MFYNGKVLQIDRHLAITSSTRLFIYRPLSASFSFSSLSFSFSFLLVFYSYALYLSLFYILSLSFYLSLYLLSFRYGCSRKFSSFIPIFYDNENKRIPEVVRPYECPQNFETNTKLTRSARLQLNVHYGLAYVMHLPRYLFAFVLNAKKT